MNRTKAAKLLLEEGAPAGVYDSTGNSALSLLIEKAPQVAMEALGQLHSIDHISRREYFFLDHLEGMLVNYTKKLFLTMTFITRFVFIPIVWFCIVEFWMNL